MDDVDWERWDTVYGDARDVPRLLRELFSADEVIALDAAGDLWAALAHQRVWVASAALPALPFILLALPRAGDRLEVELLDILWGFLAGAPWGTGAIHGWHSLLLARLRVELADLAPRGSTEDLAVVMNGIREELARLAQLE